MGESKPDISTDDALREELKNLLKEQVSSVNWDPKVQGKRLLELQELLTPNKQSFPIDLGKRQTTAGTVQAGVKQPELTPQERNALADAHANSAKLAK